MAQTPLWLPVMRGVLRVAIPFMMSIVPRMFALLINDALGWEVLTRGPELIVFAMSLSMMLLTDLIALSKGVALIRIGGPTATLLFLCVVALFGASLDYTLYIAYEMRGIPTIDIYRSMRNLEAVALLGCAGLVLLNVIAVILEIRGKIPPQKPSNFRTRPTVQL